MDKDTPDRAEYAGPSLASGKIEIQSPDGSRSQEISRTAGHFNDALTSELPFFQSFITPENDSIKSLAAKIKGTEDAYQMSVRWIYVSDETLNHAADKWLTPEEFLTGTPCFSDNPLKGREVSDCEEKANTLVSIMRAAGILPENVRVTVGTIKCGNEESGHAWVEVLDGGKWLTLDPCSGPYWDDKGEKLVNRKGFPYNYFASHSYPALQVWAYYNDIYFMDAGNGSGNAPASWR